MLILIINILEPQERHLATIESVMPIIDIAIADAYRLYMWRWFPKNSQAYLNENNTWLKIYKAPILQCDDQKTAAWASLEALQWTNGTGVY